MVQGEQWRIPVQKVENVPFDGTVWRGTAITQSSDIFGLQMQPLRIIASELEQRSQSKWVHIWRHLYNRHVHGLPLKVTTRTGIRWTARGTSRTCASCWRSTATLWNSPNSWRWSTARCRRGAFCQARTGSPSARSRCPASPPCSPRSSTSAPKSKTLRHFCVHPKTAWQSQERFRFSPTFPSA